MKKAFPAIGLIILLVAAAYFLMLNPQKDRRPNIVIILIDTLRADHTSLHGYFRNTTPNLSRIAGEGLWLKRFFVNSPWTKPSVGSFFTGLYPTAHGARKGNVDEISKYITIEILNPKLETMAEALSDSGYDTHGLISNPHLTPLFGYRQGFCDYQYDPDGCTPGKVCGTDQQFLNRTLEILQSRKGKPRFVWCHLMSVHEYKCPEGEEKFKLPPDQPRTPVPKYAPSFNKVYNHGSIEAAVCAYDNAIFHLDRLIGRFYDSLRKAAPNTILVITSDHGEEFHEHGGFEHGRTLYNEILHVPCVITGPGIKRSASAELFGSVDLMPTLFDWIGLDHDFETYTTRIFDKSRILPGKKEIFAEQHHEGIYIRYALLNKESKLIVNINKRYGNKKFEFFQPALGTEQENLYASGNTAAQALYARIREIKSRIIKFFKRKVGKSVFRKLGRKDRERLKNLGYLQ